MKMLCSAIKIDLYQCNNIGVFCSRPTSISLSMTKTELNHYNDERDDIAPILKAEHGLKVVY